MRDNRTILRPLHDFLKTEAAAGLLLLAMVPIALIWANGPWSDTYDAFWTTSTSISVGPLHLNLDLKHWVNDGLMTIFFFVVGLEIKRELTDGDLRDRRKALTPVIAAIGGMAVPAVLFLTLNWGNSGSTGWGIPMATDIAIVLGFLALLGNRVPSSLKTFLLTLAVVDDVGAIAVIALFYSDGIEIVPLLLAIVAAVIVYLLGRWDLRTPAVVATLSIMAWLALHESGVHATLIGVALALVTPSTPVRRPELVDGEMLNDLSTPKAAVKTASMARNSVSSVDWLQHQLHPWSSYLILPLFALANSGIALTSDSINAVTTSSVSLGVVVGLLIGKPLGITAATLIATHIGGALPTGVRLPAIIAASILAGVGFTVSLFIADLAFDNAELINEAKAGILLASFAAGLLGTVSLRLTLSRPSARG